MTCDVIDWSEQKARWYGGNPIFPYGCGYDVVEMAPGKEYPNARSLGAADRLFDFMWEDADDELLCPSRHKVEP